MGIQRARRVIPVPKAMACPGVVKLPPTQSLLAYASQNAAFIWPLGPPEDGVYEAMLAAATLSTAEELPAR